MKCESNANRMPKTKLVPHTFAMMRSPLFWFLLGLATTVRSEVEDQTCSWTESERDPALKEMIYDVGDGKQTFLAYVEPNVVSFYQGNSPGSTKVSPEFSGFGAKFINLSNRKLHLFWEPHEGGPAAPIHSFDAFSNCGTGTFPGHRFFIAPQDNVEDRVEDFIIGEYPSQYYIYDPYHVEGNEEGTKANLDKALNGDERKQYEAWKKDLLFNEQYLDFTGRHYLATNRREQPTHFMWRADYFGQEHWITSRETHFEKLPPRDDLGPIQLRGEERILRDEDPRVLSEYRVKDTSVLNLTIRVLSCAPRVFEIPNFLSMAEVEHVLEIAAGTRLSRSTTGEEVNNEGNHEENEDEEDWDEEDLDEDEDDEDSEDEDWEDEDEDAEEDNRVFEEMEIKKSRTSFNSWLRRDVSPVVDSIYRRAADLLRIDEALFRRRGATELPKMENKKSIAEDLQLVHYDFHQEYSSHHDYGFRPLGDKDNGARFATILFYLNGNMTGGETSFPRWANSETGEKLKVSPEAGKAVLFYSHLPDGNMDEFSQHASEPVLVGEKWLINLWVWDPVYEDD